MIAFTSVGCKEILDIVNKFNTNKASDISVRILKLHINILLPKLTLLMNDCIQSGYFPDELKIAKMLPLYKNGDVNCLNNYRPISILPLLSKILEKLIYSTVVSHIYAYDRAKTLSFILLILRKSTEFENESNV